MDEKLVESYLDNIAELVIDEDKIVTYKSLSKGLGIHVHTAKQLLYTFLTRQKSKKAFPVSATYLLAGKLANGSFNISIVNEVDLKSTYLKFVEITSEHVYSIQKGKCVKEVKVFCAVDKDLSHVQSSLVIKCPKSILKSKREAKKKANSCQENDQELIKEVLAPWKETDISAEANTKSGDCLSKDSTAKSPTKKSSKGSSTKAQADAKKQASNIAKLFANAHQKKADKPMVEDKSVPKSKEQRDIENAGTSEAERVEAKEDNLKTEKRSPGKDSFKRKKNGSKRRRIHMISDSDDSDVDNNSEETSFPKDSFPSSFPNIDDDKEEVKESAPRNKRKKRRVIDRTVMNEDGYLETRKEIVFETDSENDIEEERKADAEQKKAKAAVVGDKGKGVQTANVAKKQSSLLAFFKKS